MYQQLYEKVKHFAWVEGVTPLSSSYLLGVSMVIYVFGVKLLQRIMKNREPLQLKVLSIAYNVFQVVFSAVLCLATASAFFIETSENGFWAEFCEPVNEAATGLLGFCLYLYHLNKYVELLDTVFLCLRKKPVILLHIFHHFTMVPVTWFWLWSGHRCSAHWCVFVNCAIHVMMYYYYLMSDLGRPPKWKQQLTTYQIIQLSSGEVMLVFYLGGYKYWDCKANVFPSVLAFIMNGALILFFFSFFFRVYADSRKKKKDDDVTTPAGGEKKNVPTGTPAKDAKKLQ